MKLHLPKTLLAALLACFTIGTSYGLSVSSRAAWGVSDILSDISKATDGSAVTKTWNGTNYTFTLSDGMLNVSGYTLSGHGLSNITFQAKKTELQQYSGETPVSLILIKFPDYTWGVNVKNDSSGSLFTGKAKTSESDDNDWTGTNGGQTQVSRMADDGIVSARFNSDSDPGTTLANGYASQTVQGDCIYYAKGLRWSAADNSCNTPILQFNTTYVTNLIQQADTYESSADTYKVGNADGTWTYRDGAYIAMATAVSDTPAEATLVASGRLEITGDNANQMNSNGGDIIIGGSGQLYLNPSSDIVLGNTIYLGSSTYPDAATQGALYFGSGGGTTTLSGAITLIEDSTVGVDELAQDVRISGIVSGDYALTKTGKGTLILTNTENSVSGELAIHGGTLKLEGAGVTHGSGNLNMASGTNLEVAAGEGGSTTLVNSITGQGGLIVSSGTLTLSGDSAVSLGNINVSAGANMTIEKTVNVMGTIYSDGVLTVNGAIIMENTAHLKGQIFSDGENGLYSGGTVDVVRGSDESTSKTDRLGGSGTITIGTDTFHVGSITNPGSYENSDRFAWNSATGVLTYSAPSEGGGSDAYISKAYYVNTDTVTYGQGGTTTSGTLILNGGTLKITSATALDKSVSAQSDSTLSIDEGAEVNRSSITEGRQHVYLAGDGTYTIGGEQSSTAPALEVNLGANWKGRVKLENVTANGMDLNNYGPRIELSGLFKDTTGYLKTGKTTTFTPDICLTNGSYGAALYLRDGSNGDHYTFSGTISGKGNIERNRPQGTHKTLEFTGDVSGWTGKFIGSYTVSSTSTTTLEFRDKATTIKAGVMVAENSEAIVNVTIDNNQDVNFGDSQDTERGKIAINKSAGGTLTTSGNGAKNFLGSVAAKTLVTNGGKASFKQGGTFGTTSLSNLNGKSAGTAKNVTIDSAHLTGAGEDMQTLGELVSLNVAFAASAAVDVRNVVMQDVTLHNGTVTYTNVKAVAATAGAAAAPALYAATATEMPETLTAMDVQQGGTAKGTLTIDVTHDLLRANAGEDFKWTIFDGVSSVAGENFTLKLGDILKTIVDNGKPTVTLSGDWVSPNESGENSLVLTSGNRDYLHTGEGGLLAGSVTGGNLVLTIKNVPEPTTGTLSVLALAALAARRRRK